MDPTISNTPDYVYHLPKGTRVSGIPAGVKHRVTKRKNATPIVTCLWPDRTFTHHLLQWLSEEAVMLPSPFKRSSR
jgi:hypothetical protein